MKNIAYLSIALSIIGFILYIEHIIYGGTIYTIGMSLASIAIPIAVYKQLKDTKNKLGLYLLCIGLAFSILGILFISMFWSGSFFLLMGGIFLSVMGIFSTQAKKGLLIIPAIAIILTISPRWALLKFFNIDSSIEMNKLLANVDSGEDTNPMESEFIYLKKDIDARFSKEMKTSTDVAFWQMIYDELNQAKNNITPYGKMQDYKPFNELLQGLANCISINQTAGYIRDNISVSVVFKNDVDEQQALPFLSIIEKNLYTQSAKYISKEQSARDLQQDLGKDFATILEQIPLPIIIDVELNVEYLNTDSITNIQKQLLEYPEVKDVIFPTSLLNSANENNTECYTLWLNSFYEYNL